MLCTGLSSSVDGVGGYPQYLPMPSQSCKVARIPLSRGEGNIRRLLWCIGLLLINNPYAMPDAICTNTPVCRLSVASLSVDDLNTGLGEVKPRNQQ